MKNIILLLAFILISTVKAGTCTSISRTNSASLSVLTSTKYNTDLNTVYTAANALDGGCITDGTLESGALNTTQFAPLLKGLTQGCKVIYSSATTVQIDKCIASVNGNFVTTTSTTNASFGCTGCSSEVASTSYYVYIQTGSTGSTLTPLILTTAPNNDGYDNSGNKVLARFYNDGASNIDQYSIDQWLVNRFVPTDTDWIDGGTVNIHATTTDPTKGTTSIDKFWFRRVGPTMQGRIEYKHNASAGTAGSGDYLFRLPIPYEIDTTLLNAYSTVEGAGGNSFSNVVGTGQSSNGSTANALLNIQVRDSRSLTAFGIQSDNSGNSTIGYVSSAYIEFSTNRVYGFAFEVPIKGWGE